MNIAERRNSACINLIETNSVTLTLAQQQNPDYTNHPVMMLSTYQQFPIDDFKKKDRNQNQTLNAKH